jgi:pimeloyl-ACP methyl ester carboxylesterase
MQKKITYPNADLSYYDSGTGEVIVLIHGFAEDRQIWAGIKEALNEYRLILPDLPGSGASALTQPLSIESMAEAVAEILRLEKIEQAIIIGHSMGGYVALAIAEKFPAMFKALGLVHSTAFADGEEKKTARRKNIQFIQSHGSYEFLKQSMPGLFGESFKQSHGKVVAELIEKYRNFNPEALVAYQEAMINRPDRTQVLVNTSKPVLFIIGKHDTAVPFDDSMKLCHLPALSYIHILDQTGHMGMLEEPGTSIDILKNFIKDVTVTTRNDG